MWQSKDFVILWNACIYESDMNLCYTINIPIALIFSDIDNIYTTRENAFKYSYYVL